MFLSYEIGIAPASETDRKICQAFLEKVPDLLHRPTPPRQANFDEISPEFQRNLPNCAETMTSAHRKYPDGQHEAVST